MKTVVVEPEGSILNGGVVGSHVTEGIGMEFLPDYMDPTYFDAIHTVKDEDAFTQLRSLAKNGGCSLEVHLAQHFTVLYVKRKLQKREAIFVLFFPIQASVI